MSYLLCKLPRIDSAKYPPKGLFCATATPFHRPPPRLHPQQWAKARVCSQPLPPLEWFSSLIVQLWFVNTDSRF